MISELHGNIALAALAGLTGASWGCAFMRHWTSVSFHMLVLLWLTGVFGGFLFGLLMVNGFASWCAMVLWSALIACITYYKGKLRGNMDEAVDNEDQWRRGAGAALLVCGALVLLSYGTWKHQVAEIVGLRVTIQVLWICALSQFVLGGLTLRMSSSEA